MSSYPSTPNILRSKIAAMLSADEDSHKWIPFMRTEMRMPLWLLPAVQAAIQERGWESAADPVVAIRTRVHKLALAMRLNNGDKAAVDPEDD